MSTELNADAIERSFALLAPRATELVRRFYEELFRRHPAVQPLFAHTDSRKQQAKLLAALKLVVANVRTPEKLAKPLAELGRKHVAYGAAPAHYPAVAAVLLDVMKEMAGPNWTPPIERAWREALDAIATLMLTGARSPTQPASREVKSMASKKAPGSRKAGANQVRLNELEAVVAALHKVQAVIEFELDGTILTANENFLATLGYTLPEIQGKHHSLFAEPAYAASAEYRAFWAKLGRGEFDAGQYKRLGKGGKEIWIQASYNPVFDASGKPYKVVKFATDITEQKLQFADFSGQLAAIGKAQAVIEFKLDGTILTANENFLRTLGYSLEEIKGRHHRMFAEEAYAASSEYRAFWEKLGRGEYDSGRYKRLGKGGKEVWIEASYNPILDAAGKPFKVVKFATDITEQVKREAANAKRARLVQALDNVTSNVMVADAEHNIYYMNKTVEQMFRAAENDIRKDLPRFDSKQLMGSNIDVFHKNPAHQRGMLANLTGTFQSQLSLGGRTFRIIANPVVDEQGKRLGTVVEWADRTQEVAVEKEVSSIVGAVIEGELQKRIAMEGKTGFFEALSKGINQLVDNVAEVVSEVQKLVGAANEGDLTRRMAIEGKAGLFRTIGGGINQLTDNMTDIVARVKLASEEVNRGAEQIAVGNADLSQRTEEQASSLEETASSMEEMTSTVKQNADNAAQANQLAIAAREQAEKGGSVVSNAVSAMSQINEASKKIADIIGVIDEIAFQTNLLALNAAVEAARAGDQGRGFAVVASEVRNLAGRSATAAKEIKDLIQDSVKKVEQGSTLVTQSGQALEQIEAGIKKLSDIVGEIAAASQEQSAGIEQVNKAVMQMDEVTQQNAALVEEASAASQGMAEQAKSLNELMSRYRVSGEAAAAAASAAASSASAQAPRPATAHVAAKPVPAKGKPNGQERRGSNRPWSKPGADKASASKPAQAATGTDDTGWQEF